MQFGEHTLVVGVEVEGAPIPAGVFEHHIAEESAVTDAISRLEFPVVFPAGHGAGEERLASGAVRPAVYFLKSVDLSVGEAVGRFAGLATQRRNIARAGARIGDVVVLDAVLGIAACKHGGADHRELGVGNKGRVPGRLGLLNALLPKYLHDGVGITAGRRAGNDSVEKLRIALGHHQRLSPATRATLEIRVRRRLAVEGLGQRAGGAIDGRMGAVSKGR